MRRIALFFLLTLVTIPAWARDLADYAVVLKDPAAASLSSRRDRVAMARARSGIQVAHEAVKTELRTHNVQITGESDTFLNAIFVTADPSEIAALQSVSGVSYVVKMPRYHLNLDAAEKLINVPAAWSLLGGTSNAGAGMMIGVIDTGIDSTHPAFQDSSLTVPLTFPKVDVPGNQIYTSNKIIVARSYVSRVAAGGASSSRPDDLSARDHFGHGTAVAMAAAGVTSTGPSGTITGVAPKAFLGSYKVFGTPGVNDFTTGDAIISAIEDAYYDGMDVVVMSLGGPAVYGPLDTGTVCGLSSGQACDAIAYVVESAVKGGMVVVAAAGNEGTLGSVQPSLGTISSPGDAPSAIAVGASTNSHSWSNGVTVAGLGTFRSQTGNPTSTALTGPLSDATTAGDALACSPLPAGSLTGTIALVQRGTCTFVVKVQNLQAAGATAAIITNANKDNSLLTPGGLGATGNIIATFIGYDDGQTIRNFLKSSPKASATINPNLTSFTNPAVNQIASFSSRGPALGTFGIKPDVVAAGTDVYLAAQKYDPNGPLYSPTGYVVSQGTSFSAPQVAGLAALVMQAHAGLSAAQVKSAIVNTATQDITENGLQASVTSVGAGKAQAAAAVATNLFLAPSALSFGIIRSTSLPAVQQITFTNTGATPLALTFNITRRTTETNAHISIDQPNLSVPAGQTAVLSVALSGTVPSPGSYEGYLTIQGAPNPMQIPFLYLVGDGVANNIIPIVGDGDYGLVSQQNSEGGILFQLLDRYGVPVTGATTRFSVTSGGGRLVNADSVTDSYGFAGSSDALGPNPGANVFTATAGGLSTTFTITGSQQPTVSLNGAVNAASYLTQPVAPGSYISLFGTDLASNTQIRSTSYLPLAINGVSVSFDTPLVSAAGRLWFVSSGQVNVQIPWELQNALSLGETSAQIKVNVSGNSGALYNLPLAAYSPAFFESPAGFVAALDQNNVVVTSTNSVAQGSIVQLFLNGLGPVSNQPVSGDPSPYTLPLALTTTDPVVTIGGLTAPLKFSGLAPAQIGLYQVNVEVPDTGAGIKQIQLSIGGIIATSTIAVH